MTDGHRLPALSDVNLLDICTNVCVISGNCLGASKSSHGFHELHGFGMMTLLVHVGSMGQLHVFLRGFSVKSVAAFCF